MLINHPPPSLGGSASKTPPVSHLKVSAPDELRAYPDAAVLITAMAYRQEIERTLLEDYGFRGELAVLAERLEIVRKSDAHNG